IWSPTRHCQSGTIHCAPGGKSTLFQLMSIPHLNEDYARPVNGYLAGKPIYRLKPPNPFIAHLPVPAGDFQASCETKVVGPEDAKLIAGPAGLGQAGFLPVEASLPYVVNFENQPTATAPAQVVTVTQQLDPNLDWGTFQLGAFSFGDFTVAVPPGRQNYSTRV